ncbi:hypothetical protein KR222_000403 [Zaprionus bogoriensis]|nr:hypothetical protein KR222_000403 [Zaprionus bogoriensis]
MFIQVLTLLLAIEASRAALNSLEPTIKSDQDLINFLLQSHGFIGNTELKKQCFNPHLPALKRITNRYKVDKKVCVHNFKLESKQLDAKYARSRKSLKHYLHSTDQSKIMEDAEEIRAEYRAAESVADACARDAQRVYWERTSQTYDELHKCLEGNI